MTLGQVLQKTVRHPRGRIGAFLTVAVVLVALLAPLIAPYDPYSLSDRGPRRKAPSMEHPLGTDCLGNDILSKVIYGPRVSLVVGVTTGVAVTFLGAVMGIIAGYAGGWVDNLIMRVYDVRHIPTPCSR